jgi:hypothetical protein
MPGALEDGKGIYVDPGTEPTNNMGIEDEPEDDEPEVEIDPDVPQPGDADYVEPEPKDDEDDEPEVELPKAAKDALAFQEYLATKDGAVDFLIEAGLGLGKTVDELEAFFSGEAAPADDDDESKDDADEVMTKAEFRKEQERLAEEARQEREQERREAQATVVRTAAIEKVDALKLGTDDDPKDLSPKQRTIVLNFADEYLDDESMWDPAKVKEAIDKGFADFLTETGFTAAGKKVVKRTKVPTPLKGKSGGAVEEGEPQNLKDAFARARKKLRESGDA